MSAGKNREPPGGGFHPEHSIDREAVVADRGERLKDHEAILTPRIGLISHGPIVGGGHASRDATHFVGTGSPSLDGIGGPAGAIEPRQAFAASL